MHAFSVSSVQTVVAGFFFERTTKGSRNRKRIYVDTVLKMSNMTSK